MRLLSVAVILGAFLVSAAPPKEVNVTIVSIPEGAAVRLDGVERGLTPLKVTLKPGKHALVVSLLSYTEVKRTLTGLTEGAEVKIDFPALERALLEQRLKKAHSAYDKANAFLERVQGQEDPPEGLLEKAETAMQDASSEVEEAEHALRDFEALQKSEAKRRAEEKAARDAMKR